MKDRGERDEKALLHDPLREAERILTEGFYGGAPASAAAGRRRRAAAKPKPAHYKVICISLYTRDIEELEAMVAELKKRGHTKANKSQLIRLALSQLDLDKIPPPSR
jgi:hypothetical protein